MEYNDYVIELRKSINDAFATLDNKVDEIISRTIVNSDEVSRKTIEDFYKLYRTKSLEIFNDLF